MDKQDAINELKYIINKNESMATELRWRIPEQAFEMCKEILINIDKEVFEQNHVCIKYS